MSCASSKTDATTNFNAASFAASSDLIQVLEETSASTASVLSVVRGKIELDLTAFPSGTCDVYFKVAPQTNGSSNSPPVTADSLYHSALSATMGIVNTSAYYADITPTFSASNDCSSTIEYGWIINDQIGDIQPAFTYTP